MTLLSTPDDSCHERMGLQVLYFFLPPDYRLRKFFVPILSVNMVPESLSKDIPEKERVLGKETC
jgi:hypothetical protein